MSAAWQPPCNTRGQEPPMHLKVHNGTARSSESSLCNTCRLSTIIRGRTLDEEIVQCRAMSMRPTRVTFKVTFCSAYTDERMPSYFEMMEQAWILQPASKKRPAGFIRGSELREEELARMMAEADTHKPDDW
jgi:hypothetical protein